MKHLYRVFAWIGIGFGYQVAVYGPDAWTSMEMVGHVAGWPVFLVIWMFRAALSVGVWLVGLVALALIGVFGADKIGAWRRKRARARRSAGRT